MAEERVQRRLAAILAADVVGYTKMIEKDELAARARFNDYLNSVIYPVVATVHPSRMPAILASLEALDVWLNGTPGKAYDLVRSYPAYLMQIVQVGHDRKNVGSA